MDVLVLVVFIVVYLGMIAGGIPGLALDRTGVALLGAIVLVTAERLTLAEAWTAIDTPTMGLLFGLMVVSAQFRLGGFYTRFTTGMAELDVSPPVLLAVVIAAAGALSALLCNDIICLAMAPVLAEGCVRRKLDPLPFLLALACAANVGSAATLIGNPQNMLIGQVLQLRFDVYLYQAAVPTVLGPAAVWLVICVRTAGRWTRETWGIAGTGRPFNRWQTTKGFLILGLLVAGFLYGSVPREVLALAAAGILLISRRMRSHEVLQLIDWQLLVLFAGLFIVNHAMSDSGNLHQLMGGLHRVGVDPAQPAWLFTTSVVLSNLVSNVPATMLLLPVAHHPLAGLVLALSSTLAGNLLIVGSIANIIVIDQAARQGIRISWREHAVVGIPVTLLTLAIAAIWLVALTAWIGGG
jgi:Na+/H+ antiporter NhaD/arsenite permease-like protein